MEGEGTHGEYMGFVKQPNADWLTRMGVKKQSLPS